MFIFIVLDFKTIVRSLKNTFYKIHVYVYIYTYIIAICTQLVELHEMNSRTACDREGPAVKQ